MKRREFITLLGGAAAAWPRTVQAQVSSKRALIAWLGASRREPAQGFIDNFLRGMQDSKAATSTWCIVSRMVIRTDCPRLPRT
jgi:hypothetical protein